MSLTSEEFFQRLPLPGWHSILRLWKTSIYVSPHVRSQEDAWSGISKTPRLDKGFIPRIVLQS